MSFYWFTFDEGHGRGAEQPTGGSVSYLQGDPLLHSQIHFELSAQFADFPGSVSAQFDVPVRDSN